MNRGCDLNLERFVGPTVGIAGPLISCFPDGWNSSRATLANGK